MKKSNILVNYYTRPSELSKLQKAIQEFFSAVKTEPNVRYLEGKLLVEENWNNEIDISPIKPLKINKIEIKRGSKAYFISGYADSVAIKLNNTPYRVRYIPKG